MNFYDLEPAEQQRRSLSRLFRYLRDCVGRYHPYLRRMYRTAGIDIERLSTADDLRRLPILDKDHLRENPQAFILQPRSAESPSLEGYDTEPLRRGAIARYVRQAILNRPPEYSQLLRRPSFRERVRRRALLEWMPVHFHASTGTTGQPTPVTYTHYDLNHVIPQLSSQLILPKDRDPDANHYDWPDRTMNVFPGAPHLAFFVPVLAKTSIGTSSFETFGGNVIPTERQVSIFAEGGFSNLMAVPSYLVHWLRRAVALRAAGEVGPLSTLKRAVVGAEPLPESLRESLRSLALDAGADRRFTIYQSFGMTEVKWAFLECGERSGIHLNPRFYYWELLDPDTREPVPEGEPGVLCMSHVDWRGTVLVRYWTGDLVKGGMRWTRCEHCGYTFPRIFPPICRAEKDFTKIKGTRVDLSVLIESVRDTPGVRHFQVSLESADEAQGYAPDAMVVHLLPESDARAEDVEAEVRRRVKRFTEITPDRFVLERDEEEFEKRIFARTGIKAEYVVERRKEHI